MALRDSPVYHQAKLLAWGRIFELGAYSSPNVSLPRSYHLGSIGLRYIQRGLGESSVFVPISLGTKGARGLSLCLLLSSASFVYKHAI